MADITSNLELLYRFENNLNDLSGNVRNATAGFNPTAYTTGKLGQGVSFNGNSGAPNDVDASPSVGALTTMTFNFWHKAASWNAVWNIFLGTDSGGAGGIRVANLFGTQLTVFVPGTGSSSIDFTIPAWPLNVMRMYTITYNTTTGVMNLYINGVFIETHTVTVPLPIVLGAFRIGIAEGETSGILDGVMDEFRVYSRVLSAADATALFEETLSVVDQTEGRIYQRTAGIETKLVPFTGTYNTDFLSAPASIEIELYDTGTQDIRQAFTALQDLVIGGGTWSGNLLTNQGGMYNHVARSKSIGGSVLEITGQSTHKWGVGILIACLGQSNMANMFTQASSPATPHVLTREFAGTTWVLPTCNGAINIGNGILAGLGLIAEPLIPIGLLNYAVGGSSIADWLDTTPAKPWANFLIGAAAAGGDFEFVLFHHGEADAVLHTTKNTYKNGLTTLYSNCRTLTGRTTTTLRHGQALLGNIDQVDCTDASVQAIRQGQQEWIRGTTGVFFAGSSVDMPRKAADGFHWDAPQYGHMGCRYAQALLFALGFADFGANGPQITSATKLSDTQLSISALGLGDRGSEGVPVTGFEVSDDGFATIFIAEEVTQRLDIVSIIFTTPHADGPWHVRFQYGENPDIDAVPYSDDTPQGDNLGLPLQPHASLLVRNSGGRGTQNGGGWPILGLTIYG